MSITEYYRGKAKDIDGRTLQDAWEMYGDWETCHNFIQFILPLREPSAFNPNAPLLTEEDIVIFQSDPIIRVNLIHSARLLLKFFGMTLDYKDRGWQVSSYKPNTLQIEFDKDTDENRTRIFGPFNHNHLRMTRLLLCLTICGLENIANVIYNFLIAESEKSKIPSSCWEHWSAALNGKSISS